MASDDLSQPIGTAIGLICCAIIFVHLSIVKCIYKNKQFQDKFFCMVGFSLSFCTNVLANIFFRFPMLFIYLFEEEENHFACFLTLVLSFFSCFNLSFFTYFFVAFFTNKYVPASSLKEDYDSLILSLAFYPLYIVLFFFLDLLYLFNMYGLKYIAFYAPEEKVEISTGFQISVFTLNIISIIICLYNGNICTWFYAKRKNKKLFMKCLLVPSLITTIPFYSFIIYKIALGSLNLVIALLMSIIGAALSIAFRIKIFKELCKETQNIEISKEEEDDLVEYIDDNICIENLNNNYEQKRVEVPISIGGIKFGIK
jgi:hypothetical protein